jgi:MFS transporter, ACS family, glucarate transporter
MTTDPRPTRVRYTVVAVTAVAAMWMYIDRVCFSTLAPAIGADLGIPPGEMSWVLGAFFFTYALFQIPIGALADRYGPRLILTVSIVAWSLCTAATPLAAGAFGLLAVRLCLGVCESGAYPAAAGLVRRWASTEERGRLSSIVAFGGRIGGAIAPLVTVWAAVRWLGNPATGEENWQGVFLLYGGLGLLAAIAFWSIARDSPTLHPWTNDAEAKRVPPACGAHPSLVDSLTNLVALTVSRNMWLMGFSQFLLNVGWAFLITNMPGYLKDRFGVSTKVIGDMQTVALTASCVGMVCGGFFADHMFNLLGPRWGRSAPISIVLFLCAIAYFVATQMTTAWGVVAALAAMAFLVDLAVPSVWAFAQDVGGRQVGAALGFGNMLGNFGAALSPIALQLIRTDFGWDVAFMTCCGCFIVAGVCGLNLNATIPVAREKAAPETEDYRDP